MIPRRGDGARGGTRPVAEPRDFWLHRGMMTNRRLIAGVVGMAVASLAVAASVAQAQAPTWPCQWVHGRLRAGNGNPAVRIWPSGSRRMLGVISTTKGKELPDLPANVGRLLAPDPERAVWGDFHFCPAAPERAGWMRFGTVDRARRLAAGPE